MPAYPKENHRSSEAMATQASSALLVFGPHTALPSKQYLTQLRALLLLDPRLSQLLHTLKRMPALWESLVKSDPSLENVPGQESLDSIERWITTGVLNWPSARPPNVLIAPVTVIVHLAQYLKYLGSKEDGVKHESLLDSARQCGVQGYGLGLLSAITIACSKREEDLWAKAAVAVRIAFCIGAYIDVDGRYARPPNETTSFLVHWQQEDGKRVFEAVAKSYKNAYISVTLDIDSVAVNCPKSEVSSMMDELTQRRFIVQPTSLEGRLHCPELETSVAKLTKLCESERDLCLPCADELQAPVRSTSNARDITEGYLHDVAFRLILSERADWHLTVASAVYQSSLPYGNLSAIFLGLDDVFPSSIAREIGLRATNLGKVSLFADGSNLSTFLEIVKPAHEERGAEVFPQSAQYSDDAIAIVGMGCRFPGADSVEEYWQVLRSGQSMLQKVPAERFLTNNLRRSPDRDSFWGNFIRDTDAFDHRFFKKSSREAASMDPQQRLLLQVAYEALESAGYLGELEKTSDDIGCYVGVCASDYNDNVASHGPNAFSTLGTLRAFLTGKISHYFGWTGPSVSFDTACSSSAVAIDAACKAIQLGQCSRAIAGGVSIFTSPYFFQNLAAASFLSPTGATKSFDANADGYCRGEGVGLVMLKKYRDAMIDQDNILGVISASAVNQSSNEVPITVPHCQSQINLYNKVLDIAQVKATEVSFVEAHGTGTPIGDPSELEGIRTVFGGPHREQTLNFGSVKGSIGHTEGASGVAGLIKTVLMMQHKTIPPQASFSRLNPKIPALESDKMAIATTPQRWQAPNMVACINNYGAAGSIAAMIVCQPPLTGSSLPQMLPDLPKYPIFLSANSAGNLQSNCDALRSYIKNVASNASSIPLLPNLAFNLSHKQNRSLPNIFATAAVSLEEVDDQLRVAATTSDTPNCHTITKPKPVVLAFGGQTNRFIGLCEDVYHTSTILRSHLDHCDSIIRALGHRSLYPRIFQTEPQDDIVSLQSMQFALQWSCAKAWTDCGLKVDAVVGHSFGQLTALTFSGAISLLDGLKLVCGRAALMQKHWGQERGTMIALDTDQQVVSKLMAMAQSYGHTLEIACYNGPRSFVLVGANHAVDAVEKILAEPPSDVQGVKYQKLSVTHGFHSEFTEPALPDLQNLVESLTFGMPTIPIETCSDGQSWTIPAPNLIVEHTRIPVYFGQAVARLAQRLGPCTWLEAGSSSSITGMARRALSTEARSQHTFHAVQLSSRQAMGQMAETTISLWKNGYRLQFWPFHRSQRCRYKSLNLPPYQFEKSRHWLEWKDNAQDGAKLPAAEPLQEKAREPLLLSFVEFKDKSRGEAEFLIDPRSEQYRLFVEGHAILANPLCPAPLYVELVVHAALTLDSGSNANVAVPCVEDLTIKAPLGSNSDQQVRLTLKKLEGTMSKWRFTFYSLSRSKEIQEHATGIVTLRSANDSELRNDFDRFQRLIGYDRFERIIDDSEAEAMQGSLVYKVFAKVVQYADYYKGVRNVSSKAREVAGQVVLPPHDLKPLRDVVCDPLALDNFIQVAGLHVNSLGNCADNEVFVCTKVDRIQLDPKFTSSEKGARSWSVFSNSSPNTDKENTNDIFVFDSSTKQLALIVFGAHFTKVQMSSLVKILGRANSSPPQILSAYPQQHVSRQKPSKSATSPEEKQASNRKNDPQTDKTTNTSQAKRQKSVAASIEKDLRDLLCRLTDVPASDFQDESTLEELGIDSLMVTEIMTEIRTVFGVDVPQADLPDLADFKSLKTYLVSKGAFIGNGAGTSSEVTVEEDDNSCTSSTTHSQKPSSDAYSRQTNNRIPELAQLLASHLETSADTFSRETCLADQGLDSLLCMELASDVEKFFAVKIDVTQLTNESTFGELSEMVFGETSLSCSVSTSSSSGEVSCSATPVSSSPATSEDEEDAKVLDDVKQKPQKVAEFVDTQYAFENIRFDFDIFAKETGFADFWKTVYPTQARLVVAYVVEAFANCGCSLPSMKLGEVIPRLSVLEKHGRLVDVLYDVLRDASVIEFTGSDFVRSGVPIDPTPAQTIKEQMIRDHPGHARELQLLDTMSSILSDFLTGAKDPLQLLFGTKKNKELLEDVYTNGPMYAAITRLLGKFLGAAFSTCNDGRTFQILELGGGTGGTTKYVIDFLIRQNINFRYTFTDISPSLVAAAKRKFAKYDCMEYMVLDIEKTPPGQLSSRFNTILSTNCIHATSKLQVSMAHIRQMLRDDGFVSLVEFTKNMFWFDMVFGLLEGWWLYEDGRKHVLADEAFWEQSIKSAGFQYVAMTDGTSLEARTIRIISGWPAKAQDPSFKTLGIGRTAETYMEKLVYKTTQENVLCADVYYPGPSETIQAKRPIALMIHGGGHVMLSRKDCRPRQTQLLLDKGFLPVAIDYRLCPEMTLQEGPMKDVCDALHWARTRLPSLRLDCSGLKVDGERVAAIGWSTGGTLAMTLAWTPRLQSSLKPPEVILAFYCPTDYGDEFWAKPNFPEGSQSFAANDVDVLEGVKDSPITSYNVDPSKRASGGWMSPDDARSRLVLHMNWTGQHLPVLCSGLPTRQAGIESKRYLKLEQPRAEAITPINPHAQIIGDNYHTPTFLVHGTKDDLIPWQQSQKVHDTLAAKGVPAGLQVLEGGEHLFDLYRDPDGRKWAAVLKAYDFLFKHISN